MKSGFQIFFSLFIELLKDGLNNINIFLNIILNRVKKLHFKLLQIEKVFFCFFFFKLKGDVKYILVVKIIIVAEYKFCLFG